MATTSGSYDISTSRDGIIARALRIVGAIGQGETPSATAITESSEALNDLVKEWESDGMPLWAISTWIIPLVTNVVQYSIANGPLKVIQAWGRNSDSNTDSPLVRITRMQYQMLGSKASTGTPSQLWYDPPGNSTKAGTATIFTAPDSNAASNVTIYLAGQKPFEDFDAATDVPDCPSYWFNALKWGLADQLSYEYGIGLSERAMISKKADLHKYNALSFGTEEGSLLLQPTPKFTT